MIRIAVKKDMPAVLEIYRGLTDDPKDTITLEEAGNKFDKIQTYPDYQLFVAEYENVIVGTFALLIMDNLAHRGEPSAIVEDVVVSRKMQGKGIGKSMMEYAMKLSSQKGCYKFVLSSHLKREQAHKFYESLGFLKHGFSFVVDLKSLKD